MIGQKLRDVRNARGLSMREVARRAHISLASLSRIETNQQGLEIGLFLNLAKILGAEPADLLPAERELGHDGLEPVVRRIGVLSGDERMKLWRKLAQGAREKHATRRTPGNKLAEEVEELMAQVEFLHAEIDAVRSRLNVRRGGNGQAAAPPQVRSK